MFFCCFLVVGQHAHQMLCDLQATNGGREQWRSLNLCNYILQIWNVVSAQWRMKPKLMQFSPVVFCSTVTEEFLL